MMFDGAAVAIGSDEAAALQLRGPGVAPEQAVLVNAAGEWMLFNKADGTLLNGDPLARQDSRMLSNGDRLEIGECAITCVFDGVRPGRNATGAASGAETGQLESAKVFEESMRTVENSYYFTIRGGEQSDSQVPIDTTVIVIGWDKMGEHISFDTKTIFLPRALVRKDWKGVTVRSLDENALSVNGKVLNLVEAPQSLHDNDRLALAWNESFSGDNRPTLVFHEPAMYAAISSINVPPPEEPPTDPSEPDADGATSGPSRPDAGAAARDGRSSSGRRYFGHFAASELLLMVVMTLLAAGMVFFLLVVYIWPVR
jgi:hypothetical protein